MSDNGKAVGIFDSGLGGLTVYDAIRRELPRESLIYLGDTARVPYGNKSAETIIRYSLENAEFLAKRGIKALVVACNTSSAYALPALSEKTGVPLLGVIKPGAAAAIAASKNKQIGVIGTSSTITSNSYARELKMLDKGVKVISMACPLFVPLVEEGWSDDPATIMIAKKYLGSLKEEGIDTLILGCTHYPILRDVIAHVMGQKITIVDSATTLAIDLKEMLRQQNLLNEKGSPEHHMYVTDLPEKFETMAGRFLSGKLPIVRRVEL